MSLLVTAEQLDVALAHRKVRIGRTNVRLVRCAVSHCRCPVAPGQGARLWLDGHLRGTLCPACWKLCIQWVTEGKDVEQDQLHEKGQVIVFGRGTGHGL